jgi:hypothetical protein
MSSQMEGGIGGLSDRARDMFSRPRGVGTFEQYMNEGGSVGVSSDVIDRLRQRIIEETGTDPFDIAREEGIDPDLMLRVIQQESSGNPNAQSKKGAFGYMQLMPATAKELGVDRMDPVQNMRGGARYLRQQLDEFRTVPLALAAYNAGPTVSVDTAQSRRSRKRLNTFRESRAFRLRTRLWARRDRRRRLSWVSCVLLRGPRTCGTQERPKKTRFFNFCSNPCKRRSRSRCSLPRNSRNRSKTRILLSRLCGLSRGPRTLPRRRALRRSRFPVRPSCRGRGLFCRKVCCALLHDLLVNRAFA